MAPAFHCGNGRDHHRIHVEFAVDAEAAVDRGHRPGRRGQTDVAVTGQTHREQLVASRHPPRLRGREQMGEVAHRVGGHGARRVGVRDLHPACDQLACAGIDRQPLEQLHGREAGSLAALDRRRCGLDRLREHRRFDPQPAPRLAQAEAHPHRCQLQTQPLDHGRCERVAVRDELSAHLEHGAVLEPLRPHPPANAVTRLEHRDANAGQRERLGGGQSGEAGAYHACGSDDGQGYPYHRARDA
jgi:hypothetical protein